MRVFKDVGLVEQLGSGMSRILKVYDKNIFNISEHFIKVGFPFSMPKNTSIIADGNDIGNDKSDNEILLEILKQEPSITAKAMSEKIGISVITAS